MNASTDLSCLNAEQLDFIDVRVKAFERMYWPVRDASVRKNLEQNDLIAFDDYLLDAGSLRLPLLYELIQVDLECRVRCGLDTNIEAYLDRYPELWHDSQAVAELVWKEFAFHRELQTASTLKQMLFKYPTLSELVQQDWLATDCSSKVSGSLDCVAALLEKLPDRQRAAHAIEQSWTSPPGYEILELLGRGGMGVVYRARDLELNRDVAIKFLHSGELASPRELARFAREAQTIAALEHPRVLRLYQVGEHADRPFLVFEYAAGGSLAKRLNGQPYAPRLAAQLIRDLAYTAEAIHQCGIIHRDLKPANVLIDSHGTVKIADFGLSRSMVIEMSGSIDDSAMGTPSYAAPEIIFGPASHQDARSDIYSLGAMLYELLSGRLPFVGASLLNLLDQVRAADILPPRQLIANLPRDLDTICLKCLSRAPGQRYATAAELGDDLTRFLDGFPISARATGPITHLWRWTTRNPGFAGLACATVLLLITITVGALAMAAWRTDALAAQTRMRAIAEQSQHTANIHARKANQEAQAANEALAILEELLSSTSLATSEAKDAGSHHAFDISARRMVQLGMKHLNTALHDRPQTRARVLTSLAVTAINAGLIREARQLLDEALALIHSSSHSRSLMAAEAHVALLRLDSEQQRFRQAVANARYTEQLLAELGATDSMLWADLQLYEMWAALSCKNRNWVLDCTPKVERALIMKEREMGKTHPQSILARTIDRVSRVATSNAASTKQDLQNMWGEIQHEPIHPFYKAFLLDELAAAYQRCQQSADASEAIAKALNLLRDSLGDISHPLLSTVYADSAWIAHCRGDEATFYSHQTRAIEMRLEFASFDAKTEALIGELIIYLLKTEAWHELRHWYAVLSDPASQREPSVYLRVRLADWYVRDGDPAKLLRQAEADFNRLIKEKWGAIAEEAALALSRMKILNQRSMEVAHFYEDWQHASRSPEFALASNRMSRWAWSKILSECGASQLHQNLEHEIQAEITGMGMTMPRFHPDDWPQILALLDRMSQGSEHFDQLLAWHTGWLAEEFPRHICMAGLKVALARQYLAKQKQPEALRFAREGHALFQESLGPGCAQTLAAAKLLSAICNPSSHQHE